MLPKPLQRVAQGTLGQIGDRQPRRRDGEFSHHGRRRRHHLEILYETQSRNDGLAKMAIDALEQFGR